MGLKFNQQENTIRLIILVLWSTNPVPFSDFAEETWGCERTFRRLRVSVNRLWKKHSGDELFYVVDADGQPTDELKGSYVKRKADQRPHAAVLS